MSVTDDHLPWFASIEPLLSGAGSPDREPIVRSDRLGAKESDLKGLFASAGFDAKPAQAVQGLVLGADEWAILSSSAGYLCVLQLVRGGLAVLRDLDGNPVPANISRVLSDPDTKAWIVEQTQASASSNAAGSLDTSLLTGPVWKRFMPARSIILPIILATVAVNILALAIPLATMNIFDRVISNAAFGTLWALAIGVVLASSFDFLLRNLRTVVIDQTSAASDMELGKSVFAKILGARASARHIPVGVQSNALRELEGIREYFNSLTVTLLGDLPFVLLFISVIAMVAGPLAIVPAVAIPVIFGVVLLGQTQLRKRAEMAFSDSAHKNSVAVDVTSGIETIKLASAENWAAGRWEQASASQLQHSLAIRFWTATSAHLVSFFQGLTTAALLVYGVYLVTDGELTPGALFAANLLTSRCLGPVASLATILTRLHQMKMAISGVEQLVSMEQETPDGSSRLQPGPLVEPLVFDGVSFQYQPDGPAVLKDIRLKIGVGEKVGIIGGIGSGKSTLLKLLVNLQMPTTGQVLWNGIPVHHYHSDRLRRHMGVAFQSATFFRGTIKENITLGRSDVPEQELLSALQVSGALAWIKSQPLGLDTQIGENGTGLSSGQRQTLVIARAFLGERSCYVLDEPTSDLDIRTENALVHRLRQIDKTRTLILVSHRQQLLEAVDRLIVMEKGRILLDGEKTEVMGQLKTIVETENRKSA